MVLYISARSKYDIGSETHFRALQDLYGEKNLIKIDLRMDIQSSRSTYYMAYGKYHGKIERLQRWLQGNNMYMNNAIIKELIQIIKDKNVDLVFTEESFLGKLMKSIKQSCPNVTIVCFYHDIGADIYRQRMKRNKGILKLEEKINIRQEKINVKYCDKNIVFHKADYERFKKYYKKSPDAMIPLSAFGPETEIEKLKNDVSKASEEKNILFVCSSYYPNIIGIRWFYRNVFPRLPENLYVNIVGRGIEFLGEEFTNPRVNVVGFVESLDDAYRTADIIITPIFDGGGMKVKTMEAVSYGKIIVGTEESLHGFWEEMQNIQDRIVFQSNIADEWVNILTMLSKSETYRFYNELYDIFLDKFSYNSMLKSFKRALEENREA